MKARVKKTGEIIDVAHNDDFSAAKWVNTETSEYVFDYEIEFDYKKKDEMLLFSELCSRLPYGLKCELDLSQLPESELTYPYKGPQVLSNCNKDMEFEFQNVDWSWHITSFKPYLRKLDSLTMEGMSEFESVFYCTVYTTLKPSEKINWLQKHHFDHRGLIEKGLALEAPEGMYVFMD